MIGTPAALRRSLLALAIAALALGATATSAGAAAFGELSRFGEKGVAHGQFTENSGLAAFGVDRADGSIYVGDEPEAHKFRIQKFDATGKFIAAATFEPKAIKEEGGIEGFAIDPTLKRVYVLVVQPRTQEEGFDFGEPAAGSLFAFSTEPTGEKLEPASGTKAGTEGKLADLHPQSAEHGQVIIDPSGIALDPSTGDVVVAGYEERGTELEPELRTALERVSSKGIVGERWVDTKATAVFGTEEASSPAVSASGAVYIVGGAVETGAVVSEQIDEIPGKFSADSAPVPIVQFASGPKELVTFPGVPAPVRGGGLAVASDGALDVYAAILNEHNGGSFKYPGALRFSATGEELGWTGGQSIATEPSGKCVIGFFGHPMVAAGPEGHIVMFDSAREAPSIVTFGSGGEGCPTAKAGPLGAKNEKGESLAEGASVPAGSKLTFAATLTNANARKVEWDFGDGQKETTEKQFQTPEAVHKFASATEGKVTIKATVQTDNLATPTVVLERTVNLGHSPPHAEFSYKGSVLVGEADPFDAKLSTDPNSSPLTYAWTFGDGATSTAKEAGHAYAAPGSYEVKLTVTDGFGLSNSVAHTVVVSEAKHEPPPTTTTTTTPPPTTTTTTTPPPQHEVLPFKASLAGTSLGVSAAGVFPLKVNCGSSITCTGTVSVQTLNAVAAKTKKKKILQLATGSFSIPAGQSKTLTLHLSPKGRVLLAKVHTLKARVTVLGHDSAGASHTTTFTITLKALKKKH